MKAEPVREMNTMLIQHPDLAELGRDALGTDGRTTVDRSRLLATAIAVIALLVGCARTEDTHEHQGTATTTLTRGLGAVPETLHPHLAVDNAALGVVHDLYEGLTIEDADGRIVAGAARSWEVSADALVWTFRLHPDLHWSDGSILDARQFAQSISSVLAPDSRAPNAGLLDGIVEAVATDPVNVTLRLKRPLPYLPALLALPVAAPLPRDAGVEPGRTTNGPYRLASDADGDRLVLERNPHYRDPGSVAVDRVVYLTTADLPLELKLYRTGQLDLTSEVPNGQLDWIRRNLPAELEVDPYLSTYAYAFNTARLADPRVRRALAMAVDRERITQQVTGAGERPAYGWIPDGIPGYAPARFEWQTLPHATAAAEARLLWAAATEDRTAPVRLTLCSDVSVNHRRTAVAVADLWRTTLGVETDIVELEWSVYLDTRRHPGDCDLVRLGWSADFVDPEAFAAIFESGHPQNTLGYANPAYDALLQRSRSMTDASERYAVLGEAEATLLADPPVVPLFYRVSKRLVKPYVEGYRANPLGHVASRHLSVRPH